VAVPKATAVPAALTTVGAFPSGLFAAPPKVRLWDPVKVVTVPPAASLAVIVRLTPAPVAGVAFEPVIVNLLTGPTVTLAVETALVLLQVLHFAVTVYS